MKKPIQTRIAKPDVSESRKLTITIFSLILAASSMLKMCSVNSTNAELQNEIAKRTKDYVEHIDKQGNVITEQKQVIADYHDRFARQELEKERWMKDIQSQMKFSNIVTVPKIIVPYKDTVDRIVYVDSSTKDTSTYIKVPVRFSKTDRWYSFSGNVKETGVEFDSIAFVNSFRVTWANKKQGFLKRSVPIIQVVAHNPYSKTISMQNINIRPKTPLIKKPLVWFGIGAAASFFLVK